MLKATGIAERKDWEGKLPDQERRSKGPYVVFECFQKIPCNPCEKACPRGAVAVGEDINNIPRIDYDLCSGCGICIAQCPGLAIFVVDENFAPGYGKVLIPWEYLPVPPKGSQVSAVGRDGRQVCKGQVVEVRQAKNQDRTVVLGVKVPVEYVNLVRGIRVGGDKGDR